MAISRSVLLAVAAVAIASAEEIPAGGHLMLRMINSITTATAQEGDYVYLTTATPVSVNNRIVVPVNSHVQGVVAHVKRSGRVSGRAELAIRLETLTLPGGKVLKFAPKISAVDADGTDQKLQRGENTIQQGSDVGRDATQIAIIAGSGAITGALVDRGWKGAGIGAGAGTAVGVARAMLTRGREVQLRQGASLDVTFSRPVPLD